MGDIVLCDRSRLCANPLGSTSRPGARRTGWVAADGASMRIALGIVTLSEQGGLQRDFLALAAALRARGHEVEIFAARCVEPRPASQTARILATGGRTNHGRDLAFGRAFCDAVRGGFELVVGFNKLPGLDVYYCADPCVAAKPVSAWKRLLPRHRARLALERACFDELSMTSTLMLSAEVMETCRRTWGTSADRLFLLPPRIARDRARPDLREPAIRGEMRTRHGYREAEVVWLWVATQPATKGLDRVVEALPHFPRARLLVVGLPADDPRAQPYHQLAERLKVADRMQWLGFRDDMPELMAVADLHVHPARLDVTGQVIVEALANGLPVVASGVCGFAEHVAAAGAGAVVAEPFSEAAFLGALSIADDPGLRFRWSAAALDYSARNDFARGMEAAAELIEQIAASKASR